jgi:hypothetical protein
MRKSMIAALGLACAIACTAGCSSLADLSGYGDKELGEHGPHFFGGTQLDVAVMKRPVDVDPKKSAPGPYEPLRFLFALFDLPFAMVADIALIPLTGLNELIVQHDREKLKASQKPSGTVAAR